MKTSPSLSLSLSEISAQDVLLVGGKAVGCAGLARAGYRVPRTTVLTTDAFRAHLNQAAVWPAYEAFCEAVRTCAPDDTLSATANAFSRACQSNPLPAAVVAALNAVRQERQGPFAVRSSATSEDSRHTAFAGVFHSELNVAPGDLEAAVLQCWAKSLSPESVAHALRSDVDPSGLSVALLLQDMVPATRSGVLFTVDPSGQDPDTAVVAQTSGLGAALLQGEEAGSSVRMSRQGPPPKDRLEAQLHALLVPLEQTFGGPQDVEWAEAQDGLWYLQCRPITTVEVREGETITWTRELSEERFPKPVSPLGWSQIQTVLAVNLQTLKDRFGLSAKRPGDVARTIRHYVYSNQYFFRIPGSLKPNPFTHLRFLPGYLWQVCVGLALLPLAWLTGFGARLWWMSRAVQAAVFPHARDIRRTWDNALQHHLAAFAQLDDVRPQELSHAELLQHRDNIEKAARDFMEPDLAVYIVKTACAWMVEQIGARLHGRKDPLFLSALTSGLTDNITLRMNQSLETMALAFAREPQWVEALKESRYTDVLLHLQDQDKQSEAAKTFHAFLAQCGHLTTNWDLMEPTWGEAPEKVLGMLRSCVLARERRSPNAQLATQAQRLADTTEQTLQRLPFFFRGFFRNLLETLHEFMRIDEEHHFYAARPYRACRALNAEVGRRLAEARVIDSPDDVYFLERDELYAALASPTYPRRQLARARRASFQRSASTRPPRVFLNQKPVVPPVTSPAQATQHTLQGVGASPGVVTGIVRVLHDEMEIADFQSGEILVTASPKPTWTPVFAVAGGLVSSTGSTLSHGLVLAREYHLPAVIGIASATERLVTGQKITVDGDRGTLFIHG